MTLEIMVQIIQEIIVIPSLVVEVAIQEIKVTIIITQLEILL